jgi:catechol 2,3-dioxygenase-like lactoylglutathione lyase family enzyme
MVRFGRLQWGIQREYSDSLQSPPARLVIDVALFAWEFFMRCVLVVFLACMFAGCAASPSARPAAAATHPATGLGNFSVSLSVKDLAASRAFYEKLGFKAAFGDRKHYVIMQNETATIGLYQGMFEKNMLTFNPGWDRSCNTLARFEDVRELQKALKDKGLAFTTTADESASGPASFLLVDPDGNPILVDQHVARPEK